ncbi:MAG: hypothetical protein ABIK09_12410 [Pseudomonadota bacterium]
MKSTLVLLLSWMVFAAPEPARAEGKITPGGEALLFAKKGFPYLASRQVGGDLALEVIDAQGKVLGAATVTGCSLEKLRMDLGNRSTGCLPEALLETHHLDRFPVFSPMCRDLTAMVEVSASGSRVTVDLLLAHWQKRLHEQTLKSRRAFPVHVRWHETCNLVVVSHPGSGVSEAFTSPATLTSERTKIPDPTRGAFWMRRGERLRVDGEWTAAQASAEEALPLVQDADDLERTARLLARLRLFPAAMDAATRLEKTAPKAYAALMNGLEMREATLSTLDLTASSWTFKAPKGFEGTTIWVKVKDSKGDNIAVFKPTNGNTYHRGEIFTWRMAQLLGIEALFPVTVRATLDKRGCDKLVTSLKGVKYEGPKEQNRQRIIRACRDGELEGAVKEWVQGFQFFGAIGTMKKLLGHSILKHLTRKGARPEKGKNVSVTQRTRYYKPDRCKKGTYQGVLDQDLLARDLSDLLVMDVLNANEDRFPGANVEFKSISGEVKEPKNCVFDFGPSRLFSLDNGGTFKGAAYRSWDDLKKNLKVSRFNKRTYLRLKALRSFVRGESDAPTFARRFGIRNAEDLSRFLCMDKPDEHRNRKEPPFRLFKTNLKKIVEYMDQFKDDSYAWF